MALPGVSGAIQAAINMGQKQLPQDTWTRDWLRNKGFNDNEIGFDTNNQMITVRNQPFVQATSNVDGKSYAPVSAMQEAYSRLNPLTQGPGDRQQRFQSTADSTLADLMSQIKTPFSYDPSTDPRYTAGVQLAQQNATKATKSANEQLNSMGLLTPGSIPQERANQIQQSAMSDVSARLVPELYNTALQQHNTEIGQMSSLANMLAGQSTDQRNFTEQQKRADQSFGIQEGSLTGNYTPQNVKDLVSTIISAKQNNPYGGNEQASQQAFKARSALEQLGYDANTLFGANVDLNTAIQNANSLSKPTLAKQGQEYNQGIQMSQLTGKLPDGTPTNAYQQQQLSNAWKAIESIGYVTPELANIVGVPAGTETLQAKQIAIAKQNANTASTKASNSGTSSGGDKNSLMSEVVGQVDSALSSDPSGNSVKSFLNGERANLIAELGMSGYNQLRDMYLDKDGEIKK